MSKLFPDTDPKAEAVLIELLRKASPSRKLEMVGQMSETVKTMMRIGLEERHPDDSPDLIKRRMADLLLGPELAAKTYGPLLEE